MPEAAALLNQIVGGLEGLASEPLRLIGEDRTFLEIWGWNAPAMNRHEFAAMIREPIKDIPEFPSKLLIFKLTRFRSWPEEMLFTFT
jgi:hypothetical protein